METYLFNRALDNVANNYNVLCLIQAIDTSSSLGFYHWVPLRFDDVHVRGSRQVQTINAGQPLQVQEILMAYTQLSHTQWITT